MVPDRTPKHNDNGVAGGLAKVRAIATPTNLLIGAAGATMLVAAAAGISYGDAMAKLGALTQGAGRVLGLTSGQLEASAEAAAAAGNMTVGAARDIQAGYLLVAKSGDVLTGLTAVTKDFAAATGQDAKAAQQEMAAAFTDPIKGADDLAQKYGLLTQEQADYIDKLVAEGRQEEAQKALLDAVKQAFGGAAEKAEGLAGAWDNIKSAADRAWVSAGRFFNTYGPSMLNAASLALGGSGNEMDAFMNKGGAAAGVSAATAAANQARASAASAAAGYQGDNRQSFQSTMGQLQAGINAGGNADQLKDWTEALAANKRAYDSWVPSAQKANDVAAAEATLAKARTPAAKAAAASALVLAKNEGVVITQSDLMSQAHSRATAASAAASRAGENHAATLAREAAAQEASIRNTYTLAAAYDQSGAAALIAEARVKAESKAIKDRGDIAAATSREAQLLIAQQVANSDKSSAAMRDQAAIQADVNGMVAAGNLPAEKAAELVQERIAALPLLAAQEAAQQLKVKDGADKATKALGDQAAAQAALKAASYGKQANDDDAAAARELATLKEQLSLVGATDEARIHDLATLKAQQDAVGRYKDADDAFTRNYVTNQVAIADQQQKLKEAQDAYNASLTQTADNWEIIAGKVQAAGQGMADAFGTAGKAIGDVASTYASYMASQSKLEEEHNRAITAAGKNQQLIAQANQRFALQSSGAQVAAYGDMITAAKGFFTTGSAGYQALAAAEKVYRVAQLAMSIQAMVQQVRETITHVASSGARTAANATEGMSAQAKLTWPLNLIAMAATAAALLAAGISVFGGGGGSSAVAPTSSADLQKAAGTGTVLGSTNDKSASIAHSLDLVAKNTADDLGVANAMLVSLKTINTSIVAMAATVGKEIAVSGSIGDTSKLNLGDSGSAGFLGLFASSTTRSLYDAGITLAATTVGNIVASGITGQTYQIVEQVKKSSGFLGIGGGTKTTYQTSTGALPSDISASIQSVIGSLENGIVAAAGSIGNAGAKAMLDSFTVDIGKLSFPGQSTYATLLQLAPAFANLQSSLAGAKSAADIASEAADLQKQLWEATGDTASIRAAELAALDPSNRALQQRLYDLTDEAAATAAANTVAQERAGIETTLLGLQGDTVTQRQNELAALDPANRALQQQVYALQDQQAAATAAAQADQAAAQAAQAVAQERSGIEQQLLQLQGDTVALRQRELAALDPTNRAIQQQVYDLTDLQAAQAAASQAEQEAAQAAAAIAQERAGLESQLLQLQGDTVTLRQNELAALDPSNRALQQQIYDLTDYQAAQAAAAQATADATQAATEAAAAAEQQAQAIAQERAGIQQQLWQLTGDTASIRATELAGLDASNRALQEQVYALTDQQAAIQAATQAATEAAQAEQAIAQERSGLMSQLWQLTGDTASIRAAQLASLDPSNRALQEQIYAISDAQDAAKAAADLASAWKTVGDSIMDEIKRIRGLSDTGTTSFASAQGQFNTAIAAAMGGNQDAAKSLPDLSKSLLDAATLAATSRQELDRVQAQTASALQSVYDMIGSAVGTSGAATSAVLGTTASNDNTSASSDAWWSTFANAATAAAPSGGNSDMVAEIRQLRAEVAGMRSENNAGHANTAEGTTGTYKTLDAVTRQGGGNAIAVEQAA